MAEFVNNRDGEMKLWLFQSQYLDRFSKMSSDETKIKPRKGSGFRLRLPHKYVVYDMVHRSTVFFLVSATVIVTIRMAVDMYHKIRVRKPILVEIARIDQEATMKKMQSEREASLNLQKKLQEEADNVHQQ